MEINWVVLSLECKPDVDGKKDYVVCCYWQCNGKDGEYSSSIYGTINFGVKEDESFTPYEDLTKEQVLGWVWSSGVDKDATEAAVAQQIQNQINQPIVSPPLPWEAA